MSERDLDLGMGIGIGIGKQAPRQMSSPQSNLDPMAVFVADPPKSISKGPLDVPETAVSSSTTNNMPRVKSNKVSWTAGAQTLNAVAMQAGSRDEGTDLDGMTKRPSLPSRTDNPSPGKSPEYSSGSRPSSGNTEASSRPPHPQSKEHYPPHPPPRNNANKKTANQHSAPSDDLVGMYFQPQSADNLVSFMSAPAPASLSKSRISNISSPPNSALPFETSSSDSPPGGSDSRVSEDHTSHFWESFATSSTTLEDSHGENDQDSIVTAFETLRSSKMLKSSFAALARQESRGLSAVDNRMYSWLQLLRDCIDAVFESNSGQAITAVLQRAETQGVMSRFSSWVVKMFSDKAVAQAAMAHRDLVSNVIAAMVELMDHFPVRPFAVSSPDENVIACPLVYSVFAKSLDLCAALVPACMETPNSEDSLRWLIDSFGGREAILELAKSKFFLYSIESETSTWSLLTVIMEHDVKMRSLVLTHSKDLLSLCCSYPDPEKWVQRPEKTNEAALIHMRSSSGGIAPSKSSTSPRSSSNIATAVSKTTVSAIPTVPPALVGIKGMGSSNTLVRHVDMDPIPPEISELLISKLCFIEAVSLNDVLLRMEFANHHCAEFILDTLNRKLAESDRGAAEDPNSYVLVEQSLRSLCCFCMKNPDTARMVGVLHGVDSIVQVLRQRVTIGKHAEAEACITIRFLMFDEENRARFGENGGIAILCEVLRQHLRVLSNCEDMNFMQSQLHILNCLLALSNAMFANAVNKSLAFGIDAVEIVSSVIQEFRSSEQVIEVSVRCLRNLGDALRMHAAAENSVRHQLDTFLNAQMMALKAFPDSRNIVEHSLIALGLLAEDYARDMHRFQIEPVIEVVRMHFVDDPGIRTLADQVLDLVHKRKGSLKSTARTARSELKNPPIPPSSKEKDKKLNRRNSDQTLVDQANPSSTTTGLGIGLVPRNATFSSADSYMEPLNRDSKDGSEMNRQRSSSKTMSRARSGIKKLFY